VAGVATGAAKSTLLRFAYISFNNGSRLDAVARPYFLFVMDRLESVLGWHAFTSVQVEIKLEI
jgi:hypothetical protein